MVRVVDCHAGVLGSNPGGPKDFPLGITSSVYKYRWYCTYNIILIISKINTVFPVPLYRVPGALQEGDIELI